MTADEIPPLAIRKPVPGSVQVLCAAGLIPLLILTALIWFAVDHEMRWLILRLELIYGALVLSFQCGARWGFATNNASSQAVGLGIMIIGWLALLPTPSAGIAILISSYLCLSLWNYLGAETGRIEPWIARLSFWLSLTVIVCLLAVFVKFHLIGT